MKSYKELVAASLKEASKNSGLATISRTAASFVVEGLALDKNQKRNLVIEIGRRLRTEATAPSVESAIRHINKIEANGELKGFISGYIGHAKSNLTLDYADVATATGLSEKEVIARVKKAAGVTRKLYLDRAATFIEKNIAEIAQKDVTTTVTDTLKNLIEGKRNNVVGDIKRNALVSNVTKSNINKMSLEQQTKLPKILAALADINKTVAKNMGRPHLIYRTGRFSKSVRITKVSLTKEDNLSVFYTYMLYPYQTFEPGYQQGRKGYDPRRVIGQSIRELLSKIVVNRLNVTRVQTNE